MKKLLLTGIAFIALSTYSSGKNLSFDETKKESIWWFCTPLKSNTTVLSDGTVMVQVLYRCVWFPN